MRRIKFLLLVKHCNFVLFFYFIYLVFNIFHTISLASIPKRIGVCHHHSVVINSLLQVAAFHIHVAKVFVGVFDSEVDAAHLRHFETFFGVIECAVVFVGIYVRLGNSSVKVAQKVVIFDVVIARNCWYIIF